MQWTVLSDNRSSNPVLEIEHGLSILLRTEQHKILLDTGASDVFLRNAELLGMDLSDVDYVFISHGHSDHAGGLRHFLEQNRQAKVIVSPNAMSGRFYSKRGNLHSITAEWPENIKDRLITIEKSGEIADGINIIAHIPQVHPRTFIFKMKMVSMCLMIFATSLLYILMDFCLQVALIVVWKIYWQPVPGQ